MKQPVARVLKKPAVSCDADAVNALRASQTLFVRGSTPVDQNDGSMLSRSLRRLLTTFDLRSRHWLLRHAIATVVVGLFFLLVVVLQGHGRPECFFVLLAAIFMSAIFLGCGFFATALSTALLYLLVLPANDIALPARFVPAFVIFLIAAVAMAALGEALRSALDRASATDRAKDLLLRELNHRAKNNLGMVVSILALERRSAQDPDTRASLSRVMERVAAIAGAHDYFRPVLDGAAHDDLVIEMRGYVGRLCQHLQNAVRGLRPIAFEVDVDEQTMPAKDAMAVGLIVNELATNALKHAFPDNRSGTIRISLRRSSPFALIVEDDGVGLSPNHSGSGTELIALLARQLGANLDREDARPGCRIRICGRGSERSS